jgi:hypothetical protein
MFAHLRTFMFMTTLAVPHLLRTGRAGRPPVDYPYELVLPDATIETTPVMHDGVVYLGLDTDDAGRACAGLSPAEARVLARQLVRASCA